MDLLLSRILSGNVSAAPVPELGAWWARHRAAAAGLAVPVERAIAGGFAADRLGYAFASGYHEALQQLVPALGESRAALAATEVGGAHPRAIKTVLAPAGEGHVLSGEKAWVTLGTHAAELLIVASEGTGPDGRNRLALCRIPADRPGVALRELPATPFAPEIPHAALQLHRVQVAAAERLPGDAYERYLKPFRTIEDLHVHAALLGWLVQLARRLGWPRSILEELVLLISAARLLCAAAPDEPTVHVALGGLIAGCRRLLGELAPLWAAADAPTRAFWERDRPLLDVAGKARAQRLEVAWERLRSLPG